MQTLNPATLDLAGHTLIEASAGTGKTYTITGLYLRYLLGLQRPERKSTPLSVEQILVVTFTEAATQEIKDRVRARILAARSALLGDQCSDELINGILAQIDDTRAAFELLDAAAKAMDEAAIFTIHGFCQRMLKQHAFESGVAFELEFILDEQPLIFEAVKDVWRSLVYPLNEERTALMLNCFSVPQQLYKAVLPVLQRSGADIRPHIGEPEKALDAIWQARADYLQKLPAFKQAVIASEFVAAVEKSGISGAKPPGRKGNLAALEAFCQSDETEFSFGTSKYSFELWRTDKLADPSIYKKGAEIFTHEVTALFDEMHRLKQQVDKGLRFVVIRLAVTRVHEALIESKRERGLITPDDLLSTLFGALKGPTGGGLAKKIAACYPAAMIDEFQDTDPVQYGIFSSIYGENPNMDTSLTMIGDPKQAIYGFRGADIFTYIGAKKAVDENGRFTLDTNYRSSESVVEAVNALFKSHPNSFIYNEAIPFLEVAAKGKDEDKRLYIDGEQPAALDFVVYQGEGPVTTKGEGQAALGDAFAGQIAALLEKAREGRASIGDTPLKAADICVLVRDRIDAQAIKSALSAKGVASVYLARDSVMKQPLAQELLRFLSALHGPYDEGLLRGVLAGPLFALNYRQIFELQQDAATWQRHLNLFAELKQSWYRQGAMAMLEQLLANNRLAALWHALGFNVERWLTDYRHLAELLQHKQMELDGTARLLRWFAREIHEGDPQASQLRLESDANLVKIVTMHASKGLEYPLVFMPFALNYREADEALYHENERLVYNLDGDEQELSLADRERLAEDLRLLYVALTRAVHYCALGLYNIAAGRSKTPGIKRTALGYLLCGDNEVKAAEDWHQALNDMCNRHSVMAMKYADELDDITLGKTQALEHTLSVKPVSATIERNWRSTSFSALSYHKPSDSLLAPGAADENHALDWRQEQALEQTPYTFPKGAKAGSCLHEILEQIHFSAPDSHPTDDHNNLSDVVSRMLEKFSIDPDWQTCCETWMRDILITPLDTDSGLSLSMLKPQQCLVEMEFHLPLEEMHASELSQLVLRHTGEHPGLDFDAVKGLLKGFVDLIFEWQGRYYILDYKSNYLGDEAADYGRDNLESAMKGHQYHLQYLLYTVALHRLLSLRLADYDPARHLGGVYYLFLRAMPEGQGIYFNRVDDALLNELDALFTPMAEA